MACVESPCFLLEHGTVRSSVYVCIPVDATLAERSPVLQNFLQSSGVKELPEGVTVDSFQTWCTVRCGNPLDTSKHEPEELVAALQVCEKMGDSGQASRGRLARALGCAVQRTRWTENKYSDQMQQDIYSLPKHLRQVVLQTMLRTEYHALARFPLWLQHEFLDALATSQLPRPSLHITPCRPPEDSDDDGDDSGAERARAVRHDAAQRRLCAADPDTIAPETLSLLSRTTPSNPGLQLLRVQIPVTIASNAALLSQALLHHSTLSSLSVPTLAWHAAVAMPPAATIYHTLPRLTGLTYLAVSPHAFPDGDRAGAAATVRALAAAVSALPALAAVALTRATPEPPRNHRPAYCVTNSSGSACKRRRLCGKVGSPDAVAPSLDSVVAALSTAPSLTALIFSWQPRPVPKDTPAIRLQGPFTTLRTLDIHVSNAPPPRDPMPHSSAGLAPLQLPPLPALQALHVCCRHSLTMEEPLNRLAAAAAVQPALQQFTVRLDSLDAAYESFRARCHAPQKTRPVHNPPLSVILPCCAVAAPAACPVLLRCVSQLTALHSLHLRLESTISNHLPAETPQTLSMLRLLTCLQSMRGLDISCAGYGSFGVVPEAFVGAWLASLGALTQLTGLALDVYNGAVPATRLAQQLKTLTTLQRLRVQGLRYETAEEVGACLARLTRLTLLELTTRPVGADVVSAFVKGAACMPQLQEGRLSLCTAVRSANMAIPCRQFAEEGWAEALRELPGRGRYTFGVYGRNKDAHEVEAVRLELQGRGACVTEGCREINFEGMGDS